jgi:hypothetical protein
MVGSGKKIITLPPATSAQEAALLQQLQSIAPGFDHSISATAKGMQQCKALSDFLSTHVRSGLCVWQYCKHPPTAKPPASKTAEQAHAAAPSHPAAAVAASDDAAAPGAPSLSESLRWLPGLGLRDAASAALLNEWPGDAEHETYAPYSVLKGFEPDLSLAPTQRACASPAAVAAAWQVAQKADQGGVRALRAMYVRATDQCHEWDKLYAVYCKQPLHKLDKPHAGRRAVVPDDAGSDSDGNVCNNTDAADGNGSDGMGRGSSVAEENPSQRGAVVDGDADGAAAAGSSGNATGSSSTKRWRAQHARNTATFAACSSRGSYR